MFYLIDTYFIALANEYSKRIDPLERWLMFSTDDEFLNYKAVIQKAQVGPIFALYDRFSFADNFNFILKLQWVPSSLATITRQ